MTGERITFNGRTYRVDRRCAGQVMAGGDTVRVAWLISSRGGAPLYVDQSTRTGRLSACGASWLRSMEASALHEALAPLLDGRRQPMVVKTPQDAGSAVLGRMKGVRPPEAAELWGMFLDELGEVVCPAVRVAVNERAPAGVAARVLGVVESASARRCASVVLAFRLPDHSELPGCPVPPAETSWAGAVRAELAKVSGPELRHLFFVSDDRFVTVAP